MDLDRTYTLRVLEELLRVDSPTGRAAPAIDYLAGEAAALGYTLERTHKGNGMIRIGGRGEGTTGVCAHVDTLGLMVRAVKDSGCLAVTMVGAPLLPTLDGEYCKVATRDGHMYTGTILSTTPALHVYPDARTKERTEENLEVRIDQEVKDKEGVKALGIEPGDFIYIDTKTQVTPSGFVKSRFLDDKASAAVMMGVLKGWKEEGVVPRRGVCMLFSTYEETGHGMAHLPMDIDELLAVDMGCIGLDLSCTEYDVSICAKDTSGPYDFSMTTRLVELAKKHELSYAVDIYPFYGSDASAALRAGHDIRAGLIGPGVHASHGMERTHWKGLWNTGRLLHHYLVDEG